jgi:hypothetical protein
MDRETLLKGLILIRRAFPDQWGEMDESDYDFWFNLLRDLPNDHFENAVIKYCRNHGRKDPPGPGDILQAARELMEAHVNAEEVLQKIIVLARRGANLEHLRDVFAEDPAALRAVDVIGWDRIRYGHQDEWPFVERRILKSYQEFREAEQIRKDDLFLPHEIKRIQDRIPSFSGIGALSWDRPPIKKEESGS